MDTSVVGIYKSPSNAQDAMNELLKAGFSQKDMQLSGSGKETSGGIAHSLKEETGMSEFFRNLYGREDTRNHAEMYEQAANQGNIILTLHASSEDMAHRAADLMDRFDPVDVEEYGTNVGSQRMSTSSGSKPPAPAAGASASSTQAGTMASPEGKDDLQKGRRQPVEAAEEEGPSASAEPAGMGQGGSGMGRAATGTSNLNAGATASSEGKDDLQKGRRQSVEAAEEEGPSAEGGVRMYQRSTGAPVQRPASGSVAGRDDSQRLYAGEKARPSTSVFPGTGTSAAGSPAGSSMSGGMSTSGASFTSDEERSRTMSTPRDTRSETGTQASSKGVESPMVSSGEQDEVQKGRSQSKEAAATGGPSGANTRTARSGTSVRGGGAHVPDDAEFRTHWHHNHWISGGSYDDYAPAYRYGADYADNDTNPNHQWKDVEARMRSDWQTYNSEPGSWDKNVDAIRYGWEKGKQRAKGTHSGESLRR